MPIAFVNGTGEILSSNVGSTAGSGGLAWTPTNGNALIVTISAWQASGYTATSVTDNKGNTYSLAYDSGAITGGSRLLIYAAWNYSGTGAPTVTVNNTASSGNFLAWAVSEFSGLKSSGLDSAATAFASGATSGVDASVTASTANADANSLVFAMLVHPTGTTFTLSGPAGYTAIYNEATSGNLGAWGGYKIVTTSAVQSAAWSYDDDVITWGAAVVVFAGAGGVGWTEGAGTTLATDDIGGAHHQRQKWTTGADGTANDVSSASPLAATLAPVASGGATPHKLVSATGTNGTSVKAAPAVVYGFIATNTNSSPRFLKLYDKASAPTVGTDTPKYTVAVPRIATGSWPHGMTFSTGLAVALTSGAADSDTGGVLADEITATVLYK